MEKGGNSKKEGDNSMQETAEFKKEKEDEKENLLNDNERLINIFGATNIKQLKNPPDFYTFKKELIYSHRDFEQFLNALKKGEKCAIVSGLNASGTLHLGHKAVFDTNLYFQKTYGIPIFIPISDDESYVSGKVKDQETALKNSINLAKELLAYGFDAKKTYFIIDQLYTNIYNFAIKLSTKVTLSEIKATYGYKNEDNPGIYFYPTIQSAHILLPQELFEIKNVLVPIGPDEDAHIRICRDIASRAGYQKPSILHLKFLPGIDGTKMSKSKNNGIFLNDDASTIKKKVMRAFSGGATTAEEQRTNGGNPEIDIACIYLKNYFLNEKEGIQLENNYRKGKLLSGEVKKMLIEKLILFTQEFQAKLKIITLKEVENSLLKNKEIKLSNLNNI